MEVIFCQYNFDILFCSAVLLCSADSIYPFVPEQARWHARTWCDVAGTVPVQCSLLNPQPAASLWFAEVNSLLIIVDADEYLMMTQIR